VARGVVRVAPVAPQTKQTVRLAGGWWLVLVCSERKVLLAVCPSFLLFGPFLKRISQMRPFWKDFKRVNYVHHTTTCKLGAN
jgi:hypothetical protein